MWEKVWGNQLFAIEKGKKVWYYEYVYTFRHLYRHFYTSVRAANNERRDDVKSAFAKISFILFFLLSLSGCGKIGDKTSSLTLIYGAVAAISFVLLLSYLFFIREKRLWFTVLFVSVSVVNTGYFLLAISPTLSLALNANRIAYLGSVFLPLSMFMIILGVTNIRYSKILPWLLLCISSLVFFVAASPGVLDIYYKEVALKIVNGVSSLDKVYGPWHPLYLFYLLGYFIAMITVIIRAAVKKLIGSVFHGVFLAISVFVNIGVWLIEQLSDIDFEFLSVSYIITELFLLGIDLVMKENQRLKEIVNQKNEAGPTHTGDDNTASSLPDGNFKELFIHGLDTLTPKERELFDEYVSGKTTKDILESMNITENTLKFHNKNIYGKLGVKSRKQLIEIHKLISELDVEDDTCVNVQQ